MFRSRLRIIAPPLAIALLALAGCGGLTINQGSTSQNGLEKTTLNVGVVPAVDSAGFFVALHEGLFKARGPQGYNDRGVVADNSKKRLGVGSDV